MKVVHRATRIIGFDAAHRVLRHESKCGTLHGHRYKAEVTCEALELDDVGRVIDFGVIKEIIGTWVDEHLDHTTICGLDDSNLIEFCAREADELGKRDPYTMTGEPTAENMAAMLYHVGNALLASHGSPVRVVHVRLWETPNCYADFEETE